MKTIFHKVSVIIPTISGREKLLKQSLESIKKQTYKNIEIIVVNDGLPKAIQLNTGIQRSNGDFIAFIDDDDKWSPEKIEKQISVMEKNEEIGLTYTDTITINLEGKETRRNKALEWSRKTFLKKRYICWSSVVVRKDALSKIQKNGFYLDENLRSADDFDFLVRASSITDFKRVPGFLTYYRWHENSISHRFVRSTLLVCRIFIKHRMYLCALHEFARHLPESILKQFGRRFCNKVKERLIDIIDIIIIFSIFFVMIFQMLLCKLIGRNSWLEQYNENLYGGDIDEYFDVGYKEL